MNDEIFEEQVCKLGFLLNEEVSMRLMDLVELSSTPPYQIVSDAIDTMWKHHFGARRKITNGSV